MANSTNVAMMSRNITPTIIITAISSAATFTSNKNNNGSQINTTITLLPVMICPDYQYGRITKMIAYSINLFASLIGNILIAVVILSNKNMKKPTNYFILNMAISDLVVPTMVHSRQLVQLYTQAEYDYEWIVEGTVGTVLCKVVVFFQDVTTAVSIFSLILISVDRFIAVVYPTKHYIMSRRVCKILIFGTWLVGMSIHGVYLYTFEVRIVNGVNICQSGYYKFGREFAARFYLIYYMTQFSLLAVLPMIVMAVAYIIIVARLKRQSVSLGDSFSDRQTRKRAEREHKIIRMAIAIIITFVISWLPSHVFMFLKLFVYNDVEMHKTCFLITFHCIALFCAYSNASLNPCIVFGFSQKFRQGFMQMIARKRIIQNRGIAQQPPNEHEMRNMTYENEN